MSEPQTIAQCSQAIAEIEARRQALLTSAFDGIICTDAEGKIVDFNLAAERIFRVRQSQVLHQDVIEIIFPSELRESHRSELLRGADASGIEVLANRLETIGVRSDGTRFPAECTINRVVIEQKLSFTIYVRDITARKRAEEAVIWLAAIVQSSQDAIIGKDLDDKITSWNKGAELLYGYTAKEAIDRKMNFLVPSDRLSEVEQIAENLRKGLMTSNFETVQVTKSGKRVDVSLSVFPVRDNDEAVIGACVMARDITQRKIVDDALRKANQTSVYASPIPIIAGDSDRRIILWNPAAEEMFGWKEEEVLGKLNPIIPQGEHQSAEEFQRQVISGQTVRGVEAKRRKRDGTLLTVSISATPIRDENHKICGLIAFLTDITGRKIAEEAIQRAEEKYRSIYENSLEGIYQSTMEGEFLSANPALARMFGFDSPVEMMGARRDIETQEYLLPERRREFVASLQKHDVVQNFEYQARRKDGKPVWVSQSARVVRDRQGGVLYFEGSVQDITQRRELEQQLRQMQKVEAISQLAGGVAHDFNNILMATSSYAELLHRKMTTEDPSRWYVDEILKATNRGAALTQGLLTFSRKQVFAPKLVNINSLISDQIDMLKRLIAENIHLQFIPANDVGTVNADPSQIEQVVMNLVINARDAMPNGGEILIKTHNAKLPPAISESGVAGVDNDYVMLVVQDNGCGMSPETQARIFEPFFTTKDQGKGTGLGLATVFGIVKQSSGHISAESQLGEGTTFAVYLPHATGTSSEKPPDVRTGLITGTETILIVEDEPAVRESAAEFLSENGYKVLKAGNGSEGLAIAASFGEPIHVLLSDVIMPGISGLELSKQLSLIHPEAKVLFMSGYSRNVLSEQHMLDQKYALIHKPFRLTSLGRAVREILDKKNAAAASS